jgi:hypothetical protein
MFQAAVQQQAALHAAGQVGEARGGQSHQQVQPWVMLQAAFDY